MKLGMDEVLKVPYKCCCFSARSIQGRIQSGAKIGQGGPLLQETSSSDRKAKATNPVYTNYFYDTSVIFSNFIITYKEPFIGLTKFASVMTDGPM